MMAAPARAQQAAPAAGAASTINLAPVQVEGTASTGGVAIQDDRVDSPNQVPSMVGAGLNYEDKTFSDIITDDHHDIAANSAGGYVGNPLSAFVSAHFNY
jgi:hypothetical protein